MSIFPEFRNRAAQIGTALLLALGIVLGPYAASGEQPSVSPGFSLHAFCADPAANFSQLKTALRPRIGMPSTDRRYDEIMSRVLMRLVVDCTKPGAGQGINVNLDLYVRNSRVEVSRQDKALEFQEEIVDLALPEADVTTSDILDVIQQKATTRQQMVFTMVAQGMTHAEIANHLGVSVGTVNGEKQAIKAVLMAELQLSEPKKSAPQSGRSAATTPLPPMGQPLTTGPAAAARNLEPLMTRVRSALGAEIATAVKAGAEVLPIGGGGYAGPVMTVKIPRAQLSAASVKGIIMLPVPLVLQSNTTGEQDMIVSAIREVGDGNGNTRTFALYAFCKDEHLQAPSDLSRYSFKSEVTDAKVIDIVTRSDFRQPEAISGRLWALAGNG